VPVTAVDTAQSSVIISSTEPQFKSARLQQLLGNKIASSVRQEDCVDRSLDQVIVPQLELVKTENMNGGTENNASEWQSQGSTNIALTSITNTTTPLLLQETN